MGDKRDEGKWGERGSDRWVMGETETKHKKRARERGRERSCLDHSGRVELMSAFLLVFTTPRH